VKTRRSDRVRIVSMAPESNRAGAADASAASAAEKA